MLITCLGLFQNDGPVSVEVHLLLLAHSPRGRIGVELLHMLPTCNAPWFNNRPDQPGTTLNSVLDHQSTTMVHSSCEARLDHIATLDPVAGSVPAEEFAALAELLAAAPLAAQLAHLGIMQLGAAAAAALGGERGSRWAAVGVLQQDLIRASAQGAFLKTAMDFHLIHPHAMQEPSCRRFWYRGWVERSQVWRLWQRRPAPSLQRRTPSRTLRMSAAVLKMRWGSAPGRWRWHRR